MSKEPARSPVVLILSGRCTAPETRKPDEVRVSGSALEIDNDSIKLDGRTVLFRVEPIGLGDVHWELIEEVDRLAPLKRFTRIEVLA